MTATRLAAGARAMDPTASSSGVPPAVRIQLLATEHWSLLATRGLTWSEVMGRISIHLTVSSASLVVLALVTQASRSGGASDVLSIGLAAAVLVLGTLTGVRVHNASVEDAALIVGMNRLRAAYVEIDPTLADHLVTSWHDDRGGVMRTYAMGAQRHIVSHAVGSTSMFMMILNSMVAGTLGALVASASGAGQAAVAVIGTGAGLTHLAVCLGVARRSFGRPRADARFPSPPA
jgi:hypothetical protein